MFASGPCHKGKTGLRGASGLERDTIRAEGGHVSLNLPKTKLVVREEEEGQASK